MLFVFLSVIFMVVCLLLILLILIQRGSGSMGLGTMGGGTQMLFGGTGGQDLFQKATWVLLAVFMIGSLMLALMRTQQSHESRYLAHAQQILPPEPDQMPELPPAAQ